MNLKQQLTRAATLALAVSLTGCVGYNSAFMATKTNVGLDLDTKTPTAEISLARREVVVAPTFENGQTPPVEASFRVKGGWIFASVATTFTGGDAAATVSDLFDKDTPEGAAATNIVDTTLHLSTAPVRNQRGGKVHLQGPGTVRPLVFGTDTSIGIKVAWSGLTAQFPDSAKFGYNRKEMAYAPIFGATNMSTHTYDVKMPSFLATTDTRAETSSAEKSTFRYQQYFATGKAADLLALQSGVRSAIAERLDHSAVKAAARITEERNAARGIAATGVIPVLDGITEPAKIKALIDWLAGNGQLSTARAATLKTQAATDVPGVKTALQTNISHISDPAKMDSLKAFLANL
jgi:hypothetical protein